MTESRTRCASRGQVKALLQNSAYCLLLQCFLPHMKKHYRSKGDQVDLYLVMQEAAVQVLDGQILIFGSEEVGQIIQQSIDLYHQLGQPRLSEYYLMFQEQKVVISVGNRRFHFPSF